MHVPPSPSRVCTKYSPDGWWLLAAMMDGPKSESCWALSSATVRDRVATASLIRETHQTGRQTDARHSASRRRAHTVLQLSSLFRRRRRLFLLASSRYLGSCDSSRATLPWLVRKQWAGRQDSDRRHQQLVRPGSVLSSIGSCMVNLTSTCRGFSDQKPPATGHSEGPSAPPMDPTEWYRCGSCGALQQPF